MSNGLLSRQAKPKKRPKLPSPLWTRYYGSLLTFSIIIILVITWFLIFSPLYHDYRSLDLAAKQQEHSETKSTLDKLNQIVKEWDEVSKQDKSKLNYFLPNNEDIPGLLAILDEMAGQSGFVVSKVTLSYIEEPIYTNTEIYPLLVSMSIEGAGYRELKNFINKIESNLRLTDVESLSFKSESGVYILNLTTYYLNIE